MRNFKMDNKEEIFQLLEEFDRRKPKDIPHELDEYLSFVAKTGDPIFLWSKVKYLFQQKLHHVLRDYYESPSHNDISQCPNVDQFNFDTMKNKILEKLESFSSAPFTIQRLCELLTSPRKEYNRTDKFMRAVEKNILVVTTREPGNCSPRDAQRSPVVNGVDGATSGQSSQDQCEPMEVDDNEQASVSSGRGSLHSGQGSSRFSSSRTAGEDYGAGGSSATGHSRSKCLDDVNGLDEDEEEEEEDEGSEEEEASDDDDEALGGRSNRSGSNHQGRCSNVSVNSHSHGSNSSSSSSSSNSSTGSPAADLSQSAANDKDTSSTSTAAGTSVGDRPYKLTPITFDRQDEDDDEEDEEDIEPTTASHPDDASPETSESTSSVLSGNEEEYSAVSQDNQETYNQDDSDTSDSKSPCDLSTTNKSNDAAEFTTKDAEESKSSESFDDEKYPYDLSTGGGSGSGDTSGAKSNVKSESVATQKRKESDEDPESDKPAEEVVPLVSPPPLKRMCLSLSKFGKIFIETVEDVEARPTIEIETSPTPDDFVNALDPANQKKSVPDVVSTVTVESSEIKTSDVPNLVNGTDDEEQ